jgi:hypothetical protein
MKALDRDPKVIQLASELGLNWRDGPVEEIILHCTRRIAAWLKPFKSAVTIETIQRIICSKLGLVFEEFRSWSELEAIIEKYTELKEGAFASLRDDFARPGVFATLLRRANTDPRAHDQYVAVIDCRGVMEARRAFSRWHEIAHLLTLGRQLQFPYHRSTANKDAMERLMDAIAGEIAFYSPLFEPILQQEVRKSKALTFEVIEAVRQRFCPHASFHSCLIACAKNYRGPAISLELGMCLKNSEQAQMNSEQVDLFLGETPAERLRVLAAVPNKIARQAKLGIHYHMAVPSPSVIFQAFNSETPTDFRAIENLGMWQHGDGDALPACRVTVEARRVADIVIALIVAS